MVRILSTTVAAAGSVSAAGVETVIKNGGSTNNLAVADSTTQLRIENLPVVSGVSATSIANLNNTTDATSFNTASFTPVVGQEYLIFVGNTKATTPDNVTSFVKTGLLVGPWTSGTAGLCRVTVYGAVGTAATASAGTVTFPAAQTGCFVSILALTGNNALATVQDTNNLNLYYSPAAAAGTAGNPLVMPAASMHHGLFYIGAAIQDAATAPSTDGGYTSYASLTIATPNAGWSVKSTTSDQGAFSWATNLSAAGYGIAVGIPAVDPGSHRITGITGGVQGRQLVISNFSENQRYSPEVYTEDVDAIVLAHNNGNSSVGNRIITPGGFDYRITAGSSATLIYDAAGAEDVWRVVEVRRPLPITTVFTADGTYTPSTGVAYVDVEVVGGGGSGGAAPTTAAAQGSAGAGGGGGGYARKRYMRHEIAATTVTVGTGGAAPAAGFNAGNPGNPSQFTGFFAGTVSASGGTGGGSMVATGANGNASPGVGGVGSGGDLNLTGGDGGWGAVAAGGRTFGSFGGAAGGGLSTTTRAVNGAGAAGDTYGGGGSGGSCGASTTQVAGGAGANGVVIVTEYFS